ncbi:MAG: hypothetical protein DRR04_12925 [Gammaproteobacteria bacterium]|nr:MAG: hypothetical protein DRR04_12925 [Gammaproteobacteria bacterium]
MNALELTMLKTSDKRHLKNIVKSLKVASSRNIPLESLMSRVYALPLPAKVKAYVADLAERIYDDEIINLPF